MAAGKASESEHDLDSFGSDADSISLAFSAILKSVNSLTTKLLVEESEYLLSDNEISARIKDGIAKYIYAAGFLSMTGKEITRENMAGLIKVLDGEPDYGMIDLLLKRGIKSHVAYIYAYYFLLTNGKEVSKESMAKVLEFSGIKPDEKRIADMIAFISESQGHGW
jgi:ribosomal protein L12E/L44/L45/RPP1/RPP2